MTVTDHFPRDLLSPVVFEVDVLIHDGIETIKPNVNRALVSLFFHVLPHQLSVVAKVLLPCFMCKPLVEARAAILKDEQELAQVISLVAGQPHAAGAIRGARVVKSLCDLAKDDAGLIFELAKLLLNVPLVRRGPASVLVHVHLAEDALDRFFAEDGRVSGEVQVVDDGLVVVNPIFVLSFSPLLSPFRLVGVGEVSEEELRHKMLVLGSQFRRHLGLRGGGRLRDGRLRDGRLRYGRLRDGRLRGGRLRGWSLEIKW